MNQHDTQSSTLHQRRNTRTSHEREQSSAQSLSEQKQIQDTLMESIFEMCSDMKKIGTEMGNQLSEDSQRLDKFQDTLHRNQSHINSVNTEVDRANAKRAKRTRCINFTTLFMVLLVFYITKIIIKLVPPHPFGLK